MSFGDAGTTFHKRTCIVGHRPLPAPGAPQMEAKYSIELFREGGEGAGIEEVLFSEDDLRSAHLLCKAAAAQYPGRLIMLSDRARVLARSDRLETTPQ
jgi:hypothetical protein